MTTTAYERVLMLATAALVGAWGGAIQADWRIVWLAMALGALMNLATHRAIGRILRRLATGHAMIHLTMTDGRRRYGYACIPPKMLRRKVARTLKADEFTLHMHTPDGDTIEEEFCSDEVESWIVSACDNPDPHPGRTCS